MKIGSHVHFSTTHTLAGLLRCKCCDGIMVQISKSRGSYGCCNATMKICTNKWFITRKQIVAIILYDLKEKFLTAETFNSINKLGLKSLLGNIDLESVSIENPIADSQVKSCSYYVTYTSFQTLALINDVQG